MFRKCRGEQNSRPDAFEFRKPRRPSMTARQTDERYKRGERTERSSFDADLFYIFGLCTKKINMKEKNENYVFGTIKKPLLRSLV